MVALLVNLPFKQLIIVTFYFSGNDFSLDMSFSCSVKMKLNNSTVFLSTSTL